MSLNGFLNVDKPAGRTSFDIVARIRRLTGVKRVGHSGTLDPFATGVLPLCLGKATRLVRYLENETKVYLAQLHLGVTTDTYDREGTVTAMADPSSIRVEQVESVLNHFRGNILQVPPVYSALKYRGQRMYRLARSSVTVEPEARPVTIHTLSLTGFDPARVSLRIECSKGTYIRSLAHDIGRELGCGAYLERLTRTQAGLFRIEDSHSPEHIEKMVSEGYAEKLLLGLDIPLQGMPAVTLDAQEERAVRTGVSLPHERCAGPPSPLRRAYGPRGELIAILRHIHAEGIWHPETVLST